MKIISNSHTHTNLVDGKSEASETALKAFGEGFVSLGFTEHAAQPLDVKYGLSAENEEKYISQIMALKSEYEGRMKIWLGTERDRISTADRTKYEYILGASHYLVSEDDDFAGVDGDADRLEKWVQKNEGGDWMRAVSRYYGEYADYVAEYRPDIIAHFDLIVLSNRKRKWFDEDSGEYLSVAKAAMRKMRAACDVMEVNTGGTARRAQPVPYPAPKLLSYWHELGGRVIPASDCHFSPQLTAWFEFVPSYLREAGYTEFLRLGTGNELFETVKMDS